MSESEGLRPFEVKDCALAALSTGLRAQNLRELRDHLLTIQSACIFNHFWGGLLRPRFDDPEYNNDFAIWVRHALHDAKLAERLAVIDPAGHSDLETLRREVVEIIEERMDESETLAWARPDQQFHFITSQIVVFDTGMRLRDALELARALPNLPLGSIFFHFIDARWREPQGVDDFRAWMRCADGSYADLCRRVADVDPYFSSLSELRKQLATVFSDYFGGIEA
ncbi:MAG: DUF5752 family protein [Acidobacteriota bacterium]